MKSIFLIILLSVFSFNISIAQTKVDNNIENFLKLISKEESLGNKTEAIKIGYQALKTCPKKHKSYYSIVLKIANSYEYVDIDSSIRYYKLIINESPAKEEVLIRALLGYSSNLLIKNNNNLALANILEALKLSRNTSLEALCFNQIIEYHYNQGNLKEVAKYSDYAVKNLNENKIVGGRNIAILYYSLAVYFAKSKDYNKAAELFKESYSKIESKKIDDPFLKFTVINSIARTYGNINQCDSTKKYLNIMNLNVFNEHSKNEALLITSRALDFGCQDYLTSIKSGKELYFKENKSQNITKYNEEISELIAHSYFALNEYDSTSKYLNISFDELLKNSSIDTNDFILNKSILNLRKWMRKKYMLAHLHYKKDEIAKAYNTIAPTVLKMLKHNKIDIYDESLLSLYKKLLLELNMPDSLHLVMESNKSNQLTNSLKNNVVKHNLLSKSDLSEIQSIEKKYNINKTRFLIENKPDSIFISNLNYTNETSKIFNKYKINSTNSNISINEVQSTIENNTAIVEYSIGNLNEIYCVIYSKTNSRTYITVIDSTFTKNLNLFRKTTSDYTYITQNPQKSWEEYTSSASYLHDKLFPEKARELLKGKSHVYIIPDGELNTISFEALLKEKPKTSERDYKKLPYLINDLDISYAYSATLLFKTKNFRTPTKEKLLTYGGFAPEYDKELLAKAEELENFRAFRSNPSALANNKSEVSSIAKLFKGDEYFSLQANEKNFKENASKYKVLHLAMHALTDNEDPLYSKFLFTNTKGDSVEDNYLNAYELYNMELNADLAVLSACNTGYGKIERGEGAMSLARAFKYAGCPSIVMSLWQADDEATSTLMIDFFKNLQQSNTKSVSLRDAKLSYLKQADNITSHPYFWSNFVVLGDNTPVETGNNNWWWYLLGVLGLGGVVLFFRKKQKKA